MNQGTADLKDLIMGHMVKLTRQQQILANFVLENMDEVPFLPVPVLARKAAVSEATIVRFSQRLGFKGFSDLKSAFVAHLKTHTLERKQPKNSGSTLEMVLAQDMVNMNKCLEINEESRFVAATRALAEAEQVYCFGAGASSLQAEYTAYLLSQIGVRSSYMTSRYSSPLEQLVTMTSRDRLCCFSFPPYSKSTIALLKEARNQNIRTLAFCDRFSAPATQWASHVLAAPSEGMMFANSMTALTALINAVITRVGKEKGKDTLHAVDRINRILEDDPGTLM